MKLPRSLRTPLLPAVIRKPLRKLFRQPALLRDYFAVGAGTYGEPVVHFRKCAQLRIGAYCSIGGEVHIFLGGNHPVEWVTTYPFGALREDAQHLPRAPESRGDVTIGNDVWIGDGAVILSGVTIGNGAVIGARAVIAKDVPAYAIVVGNPAKVVRYRFEPAQIEALERLAWWNWSHEKIAQAYPLLLSSDVDGLVAAQHG